MTEREKAMLGFLYDGNYNKEMAEERILCKKLCHEYNHLSPDKAEERKQLIKKIFGATTDNFLIEQPVYCDYGYNIEIGENFYSNHNLVILDGAKVTFGDNVFIAPGCGFYTAGHPIDKEQRNKGLEYAFPITVGDNVWIGGGSIILPGVNIGSDTIIGAGSVVNKDIPSGVIAVGNPCKVLREITEEDKFKYKTAE